VREEAVDASLAPSSQPLAEVDKVPDIVERVLVLAPLWCVRTENVGDEYGMSWAKCQ
jgi:hypothetical protein